MAANLNATPILNRIYFALQNAGVQNVYQHGQQLPEVLPTTFVVLQPLFSTVNQQWATRRYAQQQVQVLCCSRDPGTVRSLVQTVSDALPADLYEIIGTSWENHSGTHYEIPVTIQVTT